MNDPFRTRLHDLLPARPLPERSAARLRIRETFDDITAARARRVTWQQIADLMNADGLVATDGQPLTAAKVNALYAAEKATRGGRRKRRPKKAAGPPPAEVQSPASPSALAPTAPLKAPTPPAPAAPRKYPYDFGGPLRYK
jgi:hypothetical protein